LVAYSEPNLWQNCISYQLQAIIPNVRRNFRKYRWGGWRDCWVNSFFQCPGALILTCITLLSISANKLKLSSCELSSYCYLRLTSLRGNKNLVIGVQTRTVIIAFKMSINLYKYGSWRCTMGITEKGWISLDDPSKSIHIINENVSAGKHKDTL